MYIKLTLPLVSELPSDTHLAAVVFHQCGGHIDVVPCAKILSGFLKNGAAMLDSLCPPGKLHVLNVNLRRKYNTEKPVNGHVH